VSDSGGFDADVDIAVIGAGHNALITAGYLAKAGLEVAVLEAKPMIGGNTVTEELTLPGWRHDSCSSAHAIIQPNPVIRDDELELLSRYGLTYEYTEPAAVLPLEDGDALVLHRSKDQTADEIGRFSKQDAVRFLEMMDEWNSVLKAEHRRWNAGLPLDQNSAGTAYESMRSRTAWDVVHSNFTHPVTRRLLIWMGFANFQPPTRPGTGVLPISILSGRVEYGWATPAGGSGALPMALAALIEDKGGRVLVNAAVSRILVENGRACGVETSDGRRVRARQGVVSSAHVLTLPSMLGDDTPADVKAAVRAWQPGIALFAVHAALKKDVEYHVAGQYATSTSGGLGSPEGVLKQLGGCRSGQPELEDPWMLLVSSTVVDPARAPGGTFKILTAAPEKLSAGRTWDDYGREYAEHLLSLARRHVRGLEQADVLAVVPETPTGLSRRNLHNIGGSCHGGEFAMANGEVIPGWPQHRTTLDRLFLTGSTAHPGGSVSGWPGRNAARAVLSATGIDPHTVMGG
jgi:phytoene dehydrogenase-like protein